MTYETINKVGSPRLHLLNTLRELWIFSEFPKDDYVQIIDNAWYYFSEELLEKDFDLSLCVHGKTSKDFMEVSGYSRPKINTYIEKHGRVVYLTPWYYHMSQLRSFTEDNIKPFIEKRGRPTKD